MRVKELIKKLSQVDQDRIIILSKDAEGNAFRPIDGFNECIYTQEGEIYELEDEHMETGDKAAIVLWPM